MKKRYTRADLDKDIRDANFKLHLLSAPHRLVTEGRNGYVAVDLATEEELRRHCSFGTLVTGTPRECIAAAHAYVVKHVKGPELRLARHC